MALPRVTVVVSGSGPVCMLCGIHSVVRVDGDQHFWDHAVGGATTPSAQ